MNDTVTKSELAQRQFWLAVENDDLEWMKEAVDQGADISKPYPDIDKTALHRTALRGDLDCFYYLVSLGLSVDMPDRFGRTPLHLAASNGNIEFIKSLANHGADIHMKSEMQCTALHYAANAGESGVKCVEYLLEQGIDPSLKNKEGKAALDMAVDNFNTQVIECLTGFIKSRDEHGQLTNIIRSGHKDDSLHF